MKQESRPYRSPIVRYIVASAINLVILLVGIAIGALLTPHVSTIVSASSRQLAPPSSQGQTPASAPLDPNVDYVSPALTMGGPVVTNTFLANRVACDRLEVNGYEPLKISDALMNLLATKGLITQADIRTVVQAGKADRPLRIKPNQ